MWFCSVVAPGVWSALIRDVRKELCCRGASGLRAGGLQGLWVGGIWTLKLSLCNLEKQALLASQLWKG